MGQAARMRWKSAQTVYLYTKVALWKNQESGVSVWVTDCNMFKKLDGDVEKVYACTGSVED